MSSPSSILRSAGFAMLSLHAGEPLRYGGAEGNGSEVTGVVNRDVVRPKDPVGQDFDFSAFSLSVVAISRSLLRPEAGNYFVDGQGVSHRVKYVSQTDVTWVCFCFGSYSGDPLPVSVDNSVIVVSTDSSGNVLSWRVKDVTTGLTSTITLRDGQLVVS